MNNTVFLKKGTNPNKHLFLVHAGNGEIEPYVQFCESFPPKVNCWGLRADRFDDFSPKNRSISSMAKSYIKQIKKIQPRDPYYLAGWCFGGVRAFEIALQLESSSEKVDFLSIINSAPPVIDDQQKIHMINNYSLLEPNKDPEKRVRFNLATESKLIQKWLRATNLAGMYNEQNDSKEHLWKSFVKIFNIPKYQSDLMKVINIDIPEDRAKAIPYFNNTNLRNLVYYLNVMRTDANAQVFYKPIRKVKANIDFFEASGSPVERKDEWNLYSEHSIKFHSVKGDHFSIFNPDYVEEFSILFCNIFNKVTK